MEEAAKRLSCERVLELCHDIDALTEGSCWVAEALIDSKFTRKAGAGLRLSSMSCQNENRCSHRASVASRDVNDLSEKMCKSFYKTKILSALFTRRVKHFTRKSCATSYRACDDCECSGTASACCSK